MTEQQSAAAARQQAFSLAQAQRVPEAIAVLQQFCPAHPHDDEAWILLGSLQLQSGQLQAAVASFRHVHGRHPDDAAVCNSLGHVLHQSGQLDEAVTLFRQALSVQPDFAIAAYNLALVYTRQGLAEAAEASYREALRWQPDFPEASNNLGNLLRNQQHFEAALECYRSAVAQRPGFADGHANLAVILENLHRLDEAGAAARRALEVAPGHPVASIVLAQLERRAGEYDAARVRLEQLLENPALQPLHSASAATELGHTLDRQDDTVAAFAAFTRGNRTWQEMLGPRARDDGYLRQVMGARAVFTRERIAGWPAAIESVAQHAPVFLVGFPRSGTTLTEEILGAHPGVTTSHEQPVLRRLLQAIPAVIGRAFQYPADLDSLSVAEIVHLREHYWTLASDMTGEPAGSACFIDKLPLNLVDLGLVRRLFPDARVLQVLRDPRDSCLSCYMQAFQPNQAMVAFLEMATTARLCREVLQLAEYFREVLGLAWHVVRYEDIVTAPEASVREVLDFVGLEWDERVLKHHESARGRYANTPSYQDVTRPLYNRAIGRWQRYAEYMTPVQDLLDDTLAHYGYK